VAKLTRGALEAAAVRAGVVPPIPPFSLYQ